MSEVSENDSAVAREILADEQTEGRRKSWPKFAAIAVALGIAIFLFRSSPGWSVGSALEGEDDANISVYRHNLVSPSEIVFDIRSVEGTESAAGMTRKLIKVAEAMQDTPYDKVYLAFEGEEKFYIEGDYFRKIGREREWQNPVYTIRTMPENIKRLDGSDAYSAWTGGMLGVLGQQLEDSNRFHRDWWISDAIGDF